MNNVIQVQTRSSAAYAARLVHFALFAALGNTGAMAQPAPVAGQLTAAEAQADFDRMRSMLEEAHTGLYRYSTKAEMDRAFAAQRAKLSRPMTKLEFLSVLSETIAQIRCGHTDVRLDDETQAAMASARKFPLRMALDAGRPIVVVNDTPDDRKIHPGMEVMEIDGRKVADILNRIWPLSSSDGDIETGKRKQIGKFAQYYWILFQQADSFLVKARDASGMPVIAKLVGVTDAERKKNQNPVNAPIQENIGKLLDWPQENQALRFIKDPEIAQIRIRYFVGNGFPKWIEETFRLLREKGVRNLIIDVRGNGGGQDMFGAMLVSYLTDKPFRYFDRIEMKTIAPSFKEQLGWGANFETRLREGTTPNPAGGYFLTPKMHAGLAEQPPGKYPFLGNVYVLIDGGTFSTAADFCAVTHHLKRAKFIGEETGGGYYGNNSGAMPTVTLPNSKLRLRLPMYEYWNAVPGYGGKRRGTRPDYAVDFTVGSLLRGVDEQLNLALKLAGY